MPKRETMCMVLGSHELPNKLSDIINYYNLNIYEHSFIYLISKVI